MLESFECRASGIAFRLKPTQDVTAGRRSIDRAIRRNAPPTVEASLSARTFSTLLAVFTTCNAPVTHADAPKESPRSTVGIRFATASEPSSALDTGRLVIADVDTTGLRILSDSALESPRSLMWLDRRRLLALGGDGWPANRFFLQRFIDGYPVGTRLEVPPEAWRLRHDEALDSYFVLGRDRQQRPWLVHCLVIRDHSRWKCLEWIALPVDFDAGLLGTPTRRLPTGFTEARNLDGPIPPARARPVKAPVGWSIRLHTNPNLTNENVPGARKGVPAFTCNGPDASSTWPHGSARDWVVAPRPKGFRWLMQDPPLYLISGPTTNPVGEVGRSTLVFRGCATEPLGMVALTDTAFWFELRYVRRDAGFAATAWAVHVGARELGTVAGSDTFLTFAPRLPLSRAP